MVCSWTYTLVLLSWLILQRSPGDTLWWLALINSFAPFLFLPVAIQIALGILVRRRTAWTSVVVSLGVFLLVYGELFLPAPRPMLRPGAEPITVMSFNIWGLSRSRDTARAVQEAGPADIIALQELSPQMADLLLSELGAGYPYHALDFASGANGFGVLSRYPLAEVEASHLRDHLSPVQVLRVTRDGETYILYNVHLQASNVLAVVDARASLADFTRAGVRAREDRVRLLVADIATRSEPVLVAGDFNATDRSNGYRLLAGRLTDAHRAAGWGFGHTFPAYGGSWPGLPIPAKLMRLDMIFCSPDLAPLACRAASAHGESDHLPVVAQFTRRR